jgi:hypothetical protein
MEDFDPSTRAIGNNAKGAKRRIGKSKKSSLDDADLKPKAKQRKTSKEDGAEQASVLPTNSGAAAFFRNQDRGSKGIRRIVQEETVSSEDLRISKEVYKGFYEEAGEFDPNKAYTDKIASDFDDKSLGHMWALLSKHNVLLYGLGNKRRLMQRFAQEMLSGEDVIELDCSAAGSGERCVKALLAHIGKTVLKKKKMGDAGAVTCSLHSHTRVICGTPPYPPPIHLSTYPPIHLSTYPPIHLCTPRTSERILDTRYYRPTTV